MGLTIVDCIVNDKRSYRGDLGDLVIGKLKALYGVRFEGKGPTVSLCNTNQMRTHFNKLVTDSRIELTSDQREFSLNILLDNQEILLELLYLKNVLGALSKDELMSKVKLGSQGPNTILELAAQHKWEQLYQVILDNPLVHTSFTLYQTLYSYPPVAGFLRKGLDTAEIADILDLSVPRVNFLRYIGKRLGYATLMQVMAKRTKVEHLIRSGEFDEGKLKRELYLCLKGGS